MAVDDLATRGTDIYAQVYLHKHLHVCLTYISTDRCIYTHYTFDCDDEVMTWRCYLHYWPFVRGIHWYPVDSPHKGTGTWWIPLTKGQSSRDLKFSILLAWIIFLINSPVADGHHCNVAFFFIKISNYLYFHLKHSVWSSTDREAEMIEWVIKFNGLLGTADIGVHVAHTSRVIITYREAEMIPLKEPLTLLDLRMPWS